MRWINLEKHNIRLVMVDVDRENETRALAVANAPDTVEHISKLSTLGFSRNQHGVWLTTDYQDLNFEAFRAQYNHAFVGDIDLQIVYPELNDYLATHQNNAPVEEITRAAEALTVNNDVANHPLYIVESAPSNGAATFRVMGEIATYSERVITAVPRIRPIVSPDQHAYLFATGYRSQVESSLSDLMGTAPLFLKSGMYKGKPCTMLQGRINDHQDRVLKLGMNYNFSYDDQSFVFSQSDTFKLQSELSDLLNAANPELLQSAAEQPEAPSTPVADEAPAQSQANNIPEAANVPSAQIPEAAASEQPVSTNLGTRPAQSDASRPSQVEDPDGDSQFPLYITDYRNFQGEVKSFIILARPGHEIKDYEKQIVNSVKTVNKGTEKPYIPTNNAANKGYTLPLFLQDEVHYNLYDLIGGVKPEAPKPPSQYKNFKEYVEAKYANSSENILDAYFDMVDDFAAQDGFNVDWAATSPNVTLVGAQGAIKGNNVKLYNGKNSNILVSGYDNVDRDGVHTPTIVFYKHGQGLTEKISLYKAVFDEYKNDKDMGVVFSKKEVEQRNKEANERREEREANLLRKAEEEKTVIEKTRSWWDSNLEKLQPEDGSHPYLQRKLITPLVESGDVTLYRGIDFKEKDGILTARSPLDRAANLAGDVFSSYKTYNVEGDFMGVQRLYENTKKMTQYSETNGACLMIGSHKPGTPIVVTEGFATASSIVQAKGYFTVVAISADNISNVVKDLRGYYPEEEILIASDNDAFKPHSGNKGVRCAIETSFEYNCSVSLSPLNPKSMTRTLIGEDDKPSDVELTTASGFKSLPNEVYIREVSIKDGDMVEGSLITRQMSQHPDKKATLLYARDDTPFLYNDAKVLVLRDGSLLNEKNEKVPGRVNRNQPTDFNDLHANEGLDAVSAALDKRLPMPSTKFDMCIVLIRASGTFNVAQYVEKALTIGKELAKEINISDQGYKRTVMGAVAKKYGTEFIATHFAEHSDFFPEDKPKNNVVAISEEAMQEGVTNPRPFSQAPVSPLSIEEYTNANGDTKSVIVRSVEKDIYKYKDRIKAALPSQKPFYHKEKQGYIFPINRVNAVRSSLSDLMGTPPLYMVNETERKKGKRGQSLIVIRGSKQNLEKHKSRLEALQFGNNIAYYSPTFRGYTLPASEKFNVRASLSELLIDYTTSTARPLEDPNDDIEQANESLLEEAAQESLPDEVSDGLDLAEGNNEPVKSSVVPDEDVKPGTDDVPEKVVDETIEYKAGEHPDYTVAENQLAHLYTEEDRLVLVGTEDYIESRLNASGIKNENAFDSAIGGYVFDLKFKSAIASNVASEIESLLYGESVERRLNNEVYLVDEKLNVIFTDDSLADEMAEAIRTVYQASLTHMMSDGKTVMLIKRLNGLKYFLPDEGYYKAHDRTVIADIDKSIKKYGHLIEDLESISLTAFANLIASEKVKESLPAKLYKIAREFGDIDAGKHLLKVESVALQVEPSVDAVTVDNKAYIETPITKAVESASIDVVNGKALSPSVKEDLLLDQAERVSDQSDKNNEIASTVEAIADAAKVIAGGVYQPYLADDMSGYRELQIIARACAQRGDSLEDFIFALKNEYVDDHPFAEKGAVTFELKPLKAALEARGYEGIGALASMYKSVVLQTLPPNFIKEGLVFKDDRQSDLFGSGTTPPNTKDGVNLWELTLDEFSERDEAKIAPGKIFSYDLNDGRHEDIKESFSQREIRQLARSLGSKVSGNIDGVIEGVFNVWNARSRLAVLEAEYNEAMENLGGEINPHTLEKLRQELDGVELNDIKEMERGDIVDLLQSVGADALGSKLILSKRLLELKNSENISSEKVSEEVYLSNTYNSKELVELLDLCELSSFGNKFAKALRLINWRENKRVRATTETAELNYLRLMYRAEKSGVNLPHAARLDIARLTLSEKQGEVHTQKFINRMIDRTTSVDIDKANVIRKEMSRDEYILAPDDFEEALLDGYAYKIARGGTRSEVHIQSLYSPSSSEGLIVTKGAININALASMPLIPVTDKARAAVYAPFHNTIKFAGHGFFETNYGTAFISKHGDSGNWLLAELKNVSVVNAVCYDTLTSLFESSAMEMGAWIDSSKIGFDPAKAYSESLGYISKVEAIDENNSAVIAFDVPRKTEEIKDLNPWDMTYSEWSNVRTYLKENIKTTPSGLDKLNDHFYGVSTTEYDDKYKDELNRSLVDVHKDIVLKAQAEGMDISDEILQSIKVSEYSPDMTTTTPFEFSKIYDNLDKIKDGTHKEKVLHKTVVDLHEKFYLSKDVFAQTEINNLIESGAVNSISDYIHKQMILEGSSNGVEIPSNVLKYYPELSAGALRDKPQVAWLDSDNQQHYGVLFETKGNDHIVIETHDKEDPFKRTNSNTVVETDQELRVGINNNDSLFVIEQEFIDELLDNIEHNAAYLESLRGDYEFKVDSMAPLALSKFIYETNAVQAFIDQQLADNKPTLLDLYVLDEGLTLSKEENSQSYVISSSESTTPNKYSTWMEAVNNVMPPLSNEGSTIWCSSESNEIIVTKSGTSRTLSGIKFSGPDRDSEVAMTFDSAKKSFQYTGPVSLSTLLNDLRWEPLPATKSVSSLLRYYKASKFIGENALDADDIKSAAGILPKGYAAIHYNNAWLCYDPNKSALQSTRNKGLLESISQISNGVDNFIASEPSGEHGVIAQTRTPVGYLLNNDKPTDSIVYGFLNAPLLESDEQAAIDVDGDIINVDIGKMAILLPGSIGDSLQTRISEFKGTRRDLDLNFAIDIATTFIQGNLPLCIRFMATMNAYAGVQSLIEKAEEQMPEKIDLIHNGNKWGLRATSGNYDTLDENALFDTLESAVKAANVYIGDNDAAPEDHRENPVDGSRAAIERDGRPNKNGDEGADNVERPGASEPDRLKGVQKTKAVRQSAGETPGSLRGQNSKGDKEKPDQSEASRLHEKPSAGTGDGHSNVNANIQGNGGENNDSIKPVGNHYYLGSSLQNRGKFVPLDRAKENIEAIKLYKEIKSSSRIALNNEKEILSRYVGWGGMPILFISNSASYNSSGERIRKVQTELRDVLTTEEWESCKASVNNGHYTPTDVTAYVWNGVVKMGVSSGNILEPAVGTGNFIGMCPPDIRNKVKFTAIDTDPIACGIASVIYDQDNVQTQAYEEANLPPSYFDAAISNVPFGDYKIYDPAFKKKSYLIHDYFFMKTMDKVKPGGLITFITSTGTLDKADSKMRELMNESCELIQARRFPNGTFKDSSNTDAAADILFLRKRLPGEVVSVANWVNTTTVNISPSSESWEMDQNALVEFKINQYFVDNPEHVCGTLKAVKGRHGVALDVEIPEGVVIEKYLEEMVESLPADIIANSNEEKHVQLINQRASLIKKLSENPSSVSSGLLGSVDAEIKLSLDIMANTGSANDRASINTEEHGLKFGNYIYDSNNNIFGIIEPSYITDAEEGFNAHIHQVQVPLTRREQLKSMIALRELTNKIINIQLNGSDNAEYEDARHQLNTHYDGFVDKFGALNDASNYRIFKDDTDSSLVFSLEDYNDESKEVQKRDIFFRRTIKNNSEPVSAKSPQDAIYISLDKYGEINTNFVSHLLGVKWKQVSDELKGKIFNDPVQNKWVTSSEYLSGNVVKKLEAAKDAVKLSSEYRVNVDELKAIQPKPLGPHEIDLSLSSTWVPTEIIEDFVKDILTRDAEIARNNVDISGVGGYYNIKPDSMLLHFSQSNNETVWGTKELSAVNLIEKALNNRKIEVTKKVQGSSKKLIDVGKTLAAKDKLEKIQKEYKHWAWADPDRAEKLAGIYNNKINNLVERKFDGSYLTFPTMASTYKGKDLVLRNTQRNTVARFIEELNVTSTHPTGAGKSIEYVVSAIESKRLGKTTKPMLVVPDHMMLEFIDIAQQLYPNANILAINEKDMSADKRKGFGAKCALGDWDIVISTHSIFDRIPVSKTLEMEIMNEEIWKYEKLLSNIGSTDENIAQRATVKQIESAKKKLEAKFKALTASENKDDGLSLEQMGVDALIVDEFHRYKNLQTVTNMAHVNGVNTAFSQRAQHFYSATRLMNKIHGEDKGVMIGSATPIDNSMSEIYTIMRIQKRQTLEEMGLDSFDSFAGTFFEQVTKLEILPEGSGYRENTRLSNVVNLPELVRLFRTTADIVREDSLNLIKPTVGTHINSYEPNEWQQAFMRHLGARAIKVRNGSVKPEEDNILKIMSDGMKAAIDIRLIDETLPDDENSKVNNCVRRVLNIWANTKEDRLTQAIMLDTSTPKAQGKFSLYQDIKDKLMAGGMPEKEIAFIHSYKSAIAKQKLHKQVRNGNVRVVLGSTEKLGTGTNIQDLLVNLEHLDIGHTPKCRKQRLGRIDRTGNQNTFVTENINTTQDSLELFRWETVERKERFITQAMTDPDNAIRRLSEDTDLTCADVISATTCNDAIKDKINAQIKVDHLDLLRREHFDSIWRNRENIKHLSNQIENSHTIIDRYEEDLSRFSENEEFSMVINGDSYKDKREAGHKLLSHLIEAVHGSLSGVSKKSIGEYKGMNIAAGHKQTFLAGKTKDNYHVVLKGAMDWKVDVAISPSVTLKRIENIDDTIKVSISRHAEYIVRNKDDIKQLELTLDNEFDHQSELEKARVRLTAINQQVAEAAMSSNLVVYDVDEFPSMLEEHREEVKNSDKPHRMASLSP